MNKNKNNQTIWNARIKKNTSIIFQKVGGSISIDKKLYKEDIDGITNFLKQGRGIFCNSSTPYCLVVFIFVHDI